MHSRKSSHMFKSNFSYESSISQRLSKNSQNVISIAKKLNVQPSKFAKKPTKIINVTNLRKNPLPNSSRNMPVVQTEANATKAISCSARFIIGTEGLPVIVKASENTEIEASATVRNVSRRKVIRVKKIDYVLTNAVDFLDGLCKKVSSTGLIESDPLNEIKKRFAVSKKTMRSLKKTVRQAAKPSLVVEKLKHREEFEMLRRKKKKHDNFRYNNAESPIYNYFKKAFGEDMSDVWRVEREARMRETRIDESEKTNKKVIRSLVQKINFHRANINDRFKTILTERSAILLT